MVYILLGTGFEEAEALVPADLLRRAGVEVALVGVTGKEVTGAHGITVKADLLLEEVAPNAMELVMLPGGLGGVEAIASSPAALELVRLAYDKEIPLAAICAAPTILAKMGLLDGRSATCYPGMEDEMPGANMTCAPIVEDGSIITGEAAGSAFQFGLALVKHLKGEQAALAVKQAIHYHG